MGWCDPCATDPPTNEELTQLGVFWETQDVFITRLHVRYDADHFPDDLRFQETGDRANFQGRYVLRHPWMGAERCDAATQYRQILAHRHEEQAQTLASLTGWDIQTIRRKMGTDDLYPLPDERSWWQRIWQR